MYHVWVLNMRAQPPTIEAHAESGNVDTLKKCAWAFAATFPGPEFTLVHEINAQPLEIREL